MNMENNKLIIIIAILCLGAFGVYYAKSAPFSKKEELSENGQIIETNEVDMIKEETVPQTSVNEESTEASQESIIEGNVKEFSMDSYYDGDGMWFSLKEIDVNKGDLVKINVKNTKGMHNFNIDEYNIKTETPLDEVTTIEFVADKSGDFVYYCSKPGHKENGQWGTLKVSDL